MDNLQCVNGTIMNMKGASIMMALNEYIGANVNAQMTMSGQTIAWHRQHPENFMDKQQQQRKANGLKSWHIAIQ